MSLDLKVDIFNSQNRCKVVVSNELGRQLEHFNWALFRRFIADSRTNPLQSICKSLCLKTETDKTCKIRINADSFSLTKILMKLMQSHLPLMSLGQFFFDFRSFLSHFYVMKIALIFFQVSPPTAHADSKFLAMHQNKDDHIAPVCIN